MTTDILRKEKKIFARWPLLIFCLLAWGNFPAAARAEETLTNASAILSLSAKDALRGVPVLVRGVVTAAETNWDGRFFVQDASGGVFVDNVNHPQPFPGDVVEVTGKTHRGGYAPVITKPHWKKLGTASLPDARPVTVERLMSGAEDSQRVEISGIVRTAQFSGNTIGVELASGGCRFRAYFPIPPNMVPQSLVGAKILLRGTVAAAFNGSLRQILTVTLFAPQLSDFIIEQPAAANPFEEPLTPLNGIAQYRHDSSPANQVHVQGMVTYQRKGEDFFLQDANGGLQVKSKLNESLKPGDIVEAVGFPAVENFLPVLEDAVFRKLSDARTNPAPKSATIAALEKGYHQGDFIKLRGRLIGRLASGIGQSARSPDIQTALVLETTNFIFVAEKDTSGQNDFLSMIPLGSLVEVRGICLLETAEDGKIKSFHLLLPTSHDVQVIEKPSWLTPQHLMVSVVILLVILLMAIGWTVFVAKKNSILNLLVREKETAQRQLQQAHDQLEERVAERTAQLKVEMTARKESQLQFRAVLTERTRLAQELHDTLEQTMTGIALQQDLIASQFEKNPASAAHHLKLARSLMRQSQVDLRRSVWGLRSRADEPFNLTSALTTSVRQIAEDAGIRMEVETTGDAVPMSEVIEENLLRIGQEAVTNVVKHAGATRVKIEFHFTTQLVSLQITDDGKGFTLETCAGPKDGHFGMLGIRERAERLGGKVFFHSAPGMGMSVQVKIPISMDEDAPPSPSLATHEAEL